MTFVTEKTENRRSLTDAAAADAGVTAAVVDVFGRRIADRKVSP